MEKKQGALAAVLVIVILVAIGLIVHKARPSAASAPPTNMPMGPDQVLGKAGAQGTPGGGGR